MATRMQQFRNACQKCFDFLIEVVPLWVYIAFFVVVVIGTAIAYWLLTPLGDGMGQNGKLLACASFSDGLYFSIVTVSSLGYGDIYPLGYSRALACSEVLFGLTFMGIMVARLTSRRLSYHVQRLFSSDAQRRLDELAGEFERLQPELLERMKNLGAAYQATPAQPGQTATNKVTARERFEVTLSAMHAKSGILADYFIRELEVEQTGFFGIAPLTSVRRVTIAVEKNLFYMSQLIISLSPEARTDILGGDIRQRISEALSCSVKVCDLIDRHAKDTETKNCAARMRDICQKVSQAYFETPVPLAATESPDQVVPSADQPSIVVDGH